MASVCAGREITVAWDANPASDNVTGYKVYKEKVLNSGAFEEIIDVKNVTQAKLDFDDSETTIIVTAYNEAGLESLPSEPLTIPAKRPGRVKSLRIEINF